MVGGEVSPAIVKETHHADSHLSQVNRGVGEGIEVAHSW
jgi:hypothetical protein